MRLANKAAIVTGGAHGMGEAIARIFSAEGARVMLCDLRADLGEKVVAGIREGGGDAEFMEMDVTSDASWSMLMDKTMASFGKLDILVNNAGISGSAFANPADRDGWNKIMDVNATSVFLGTTAAAQHMQASGGGSIVNICSIMGMVGSASGHPAYHASKAAVRNYTKAAACLYGEHWIRVNAVMPGYFPSMLSSARRSSTDDARSVIERLAQELPLKRVGRPEEVGYAALFLASDEAQYITGTDLVIDGGYVAR
jgi:NAD(P)-dependent dehydrogenase (short-subunit alcohol dehydrogenase family)